MIPLNETEQERNRAYILSELLHAEEGHEWTFCMSVKIDGAKQSTRHLSIDRATFEKIKALFLDRVTA